MNRKLFEQTLRRTFWVPFAIAFVVALTLILEVRFLMDRTAWVEHTDQVIALSQRIYRSRVDQETGLRAWLLTRDERFLGPFSEGGKQALVNETELRKLIADNPEQIARNEESIRAFRAWADWADQAIAMTRSGGNAGSVTFQLRGKELMDNYRRIRAGFIEREQQLRDQRLERSRRTFEFVNASIVALGVLFALGVAFLGRNQLTRLSQSFAEALNAAQEQRDWLHTTLTSIGDAVITTDADGRITLMNRVAEKLTGWHLHEAEGKPLTEVFPIVNQETRQAVENPVDKVRRLNQVVGLANHTILIDKSGQDIAIDDNGAPIFGPDGSLAGIVLVFRDVTEARKTAAALELATAEARSQHDRLRGIIDSAMDAIITVDESQRIRVFNHAAEQVFRCSAADALSQPLEMFVPESFRKAHQSHVELFGASGITNRSMLRPGTLWGLRADGEEFPLEASISQVERGGQKLFTVILRDITERKHAEADLDRERERLSLALTTGMMGVYEMEVTQDVLWLSPESYVLLGTTPEHFSPSPESFLTLVHPQDRELLMEHIRQSIKAHEPINHEFRILRPNGKECWIGCRGQIEYNEEGQAVRHSGLLIDITLRKQSEQMLRRWEKLAAAARLSAAMAHEINNPLGAVVNLIYIVKTLPGMPRAADQLLVQVEHELERVAHATRQTLGFYRESSSPERIDVPALIESVLELYSTKLVSKYISIERAFGECAPIQGVRGEVRQAVSNVIANAIDAVPKGGVIVVGIRSVPGDRDGAAEIVIADNGPGIAPEDADRIFEPFFTTKGGTAMGLGLWVAKDIVERHGGTITASSRAEESELRGATFTIKFPRAFRVRREESKTHAAIPSKRGESSS